MNVPHQPNEQAASSRALTVLLGVTGSIAAYKSCELLRLLQDAGLRVKVVMTEHAQSFVGAATFKALSGEPVAVDLFDEPGAPVHHVSLAQEADVMVIAPCTANVLNKIANGVADDLLTTVALALTTPLIVAPAMNQDMLDNPITQGSIQKLLAQGVTFVSPGYGHLACGSEGAGRLAQTKDICNAVLDEVGHSQQLAGKRVLITAGPTREYIDPVRFISSPASGKTGFALAREAARRGAEVTLVSGPVAIPAPQGVTLVAVQTARQMFEAAGDHFDDCDIVVFSAAVADFSLQETADHKLKKGSDLDTNGYDLRLVATPDILAELAARRSRQFIVGFAAETSDVVAHARAKLMAKGADLIVANDVSDPARGFASDHNQVWLVGPDYVEETAVVTKNRLARIILDRIAASLC
ncbi:MAG: bifunctional phosphopantothenoylcysteine decarboxylase/phosphopantothenate--cysteine ligase CoaBC [Coriobacteriales bacterium]|nr:bifunctional phosphopantothenoylcysteine decarboxylase/phosphopantothenate--cysteine ligase CoaBC [Coriobacteriales bacterium]